MNTFKRIGALLIVFVLVGLYVATLILSFMKNPLAQDLFKGCIVLTIAVPVIIYAYTLMYKYLNGKNDKQ